LLHAPHYAYKTKQIPADQNAILTFTNENLSETYTFTVRGFPFWTLVIIGTHDWLRSKLIPFLWYHTNYWISWFAHKISPFTAFRACMCRTYLSFTAEHKSHFFNK